MFWRVSKERNFARPYGLITFVPSPDDPGPAIGAARLDYSFVKELKDVLAQEETYLSGN